MYCVTCRLPDNQCRTVAMECCDRHDHAVDGAVCVTMAVVLLIVVQMTDADMQEYYDNFFEEVFVETNDKVAHSRR